MSHMTVTALLFHFLLMVQSAPSGLSRLSVVSQRASSLLEKILRDIPALHAATVHIQGLTLDPASQTAELQLMASSLGLPAPPLLKPPSQHFTLDQCVSRMLAGCRLYQNLLGVLAQWLTGLSDLRADLRDLHTHISKMKEAAGLDQDQDQDQDQGLVLSSLDGDYSKQVALHLTLMQLRSFCHDLSRSLRAINSYKPRPSAAN